MTILSRPSKDLRLRLGALATHEQPAGSGVSLLPVMAVVFVGFLIVGFALP